MVFGKVFREVFEKGIVGGFWEGWLRRFFGEGFSVRFC